MSARDDDPYAVHSIVETAAADAVAGKVVWAGPISLWNGAMMIGTLIGGPLLFSWSAFALFVASTALGLLLGHSVGFHRRLIHGSFKCPLWVEHALVYAGVLVGMCGPFGIIRAHDLRDWAQRQPHCHPYLRHGAPMALDALWQLHGRLALRHPPRMVIPERIARDRFYRFLERTWMLQQLPVAVALYLVGGWPFVVWGVCARVFASVTGHWLVGHLAHNRGPQTWLVETSGVQAFDVPWAAIPTMGEAWHNNHHAYPGSARIGLYPGQFDWGFRFIQLLEWLGLAWDVRTPASLPARPELTRASANHLPPPLAGAGDPKGVVGAAAARALSGSSISTRWEKRRIA
jgi:stearoyl-CoA desaturase (delta-9 desaturase)